MSGCIRGCIVLFFCVLCACAKDEAKKIQKVSAITFDEFKRIEAVTVEARAADPACAGDCQELRREFRYVVYVGKQIYCYWDEKKAETNTDYDTLAKSLESRIVDSTSLSQYYKLLRQWAAAFHDGHVNVMAGNQLAKLEIYSAPVRLELIAPATDHEKLVISDAGSVSGIASGDQVLAVNGVPSGKAINNAVLITSGSTERMRRYRATKYLVDSVGSDEGIAPLVLTVLRNGKPNDIEVPRNVDINVPPVENPVQGPVEPGSRYLKVQVLPGQIGYFRIDAFSGAQDSYLLDTMMDRLLLTRALILDVRANGGGDQSGDAILARLIDKTITRYRISERMSDYLLATRPDLIDRPDWTEGQAFANWFFKPIQPLADASKRYIGKPVVVLTGPGCFSACDTFTSALKTNGLAKVFGEGTGGGTGSPLVFDLPYSGLQFRYSVARGRTALGDPIEGAGTLPDFYIEPSVEDRALRRDGQLLSTISTLRQQLGIAVSPVDATPAIATQNLIWEQELSRSPTARDELELQRLSRIDELD
jgi:carboxyl-terminal processing protease